MLDGGVDVLKAKEIFELGERAKEEVCKAVDIAVAVRIANLVMEDAIDHSLKILDKDLPQDSVLRPFYGLNYFNTYKRAPNNTTLFLNWLGARDTFDINQFVNQYSCINMDQAQKIIQHQILKKRLIQLSNTKFKVVKPKEGE